MKRLSELWASRCNMFNFIEQTRQIDKICSIILNIWTSELCRECIDESVYFFRTY